MLSHPTLLTSYTSLSPATPTARSFRHRKDERRTLTSKITIGNHSAQYANNFEEITHPPLLLKNVQGRTMSTGDANKFEEITHPPLLLKNVQGRTMSTGDANNFEEVTHPPLLLKNVQGRTMSTGVVDIIKEVEKNCSRSMPKACHS